MIFTIQPSGGFIEISKRTEMMNIFQTSNYLRSRGQSVDCRNIGIMDKWQGKIQVKTLPLTISQLLAQINTSLCKVISTS